MLEQILNMIIVIILLNGAIPARLAPKTKFPKIGRMGLVSFFQHALSLDHG